MNDVTELFSVHRETVSRWIKRYESDGIQGLKDKLKSGRPIANKSNLLKKICLR